MFRVIDAKRLGKDDVKSLLRKDAASSDEEESAEED